jgi:transmembrane sensor
VLLEGEAYFRAVDDPARPFLVEAAGARARGTAFDVKLADGTVTVVAGEQAVEVAVDGRPSVLVASGQEVRYRRGALGEVREVDLARVESWRHDRLVFRDAPLRDVVADLQRYRVGRIVLTEPRLGDLPVNAEFETRQADVALDRITAALPVRVWRLTSLLVVLSPRT